ncbi:MAG: NADH-quinone oxidoreductase subunit L [Chloroflexi bacterium]|nr:NADH-quinone oxidoreductase subunit L [Chloroflexota bacterium]
MFDLVPLIVVFPAIGLIVNLFWGKRFSEQTSGWIASAAAGLSFVVTVLLMIALAGQSEGETVKLVDWIVVGDLDIAWRFQVDTLSVTMMMVVTGVGTLIHVYSIGYMHGDPKYPRFFVYLNLFLIAMLVLVSASSFPMLFVGWEGVGLCSFLLIGFWFDRAGDAGRNNSEAARKAFILNRIGDFGFLFAMLLLFREFGTLEFEGVFAHAEETLESDSTLAIGITLCLLLGVTAKSAQIPLYTWLPDAMAGPTPASALIHAATMVTAGVYLITRTHVLFELAPFSADVTAAVGGVTALLAATIAVGQYDIKRVLAYSTISQLGFMVAAVGMGAYVAGIFHLITHAFFKALLFLAAGSVIHGVEHGHHDSNEPFDAQDMRNMGGLRHKMPTTFWVYIIGAVALAGIPPLAGFFSKDEILNAGMEHNLPVYILLTLAAFLTAFYMGRQVFMVFFGETRSDAAERAVESSSLMLWPMMGLAGLATVGGILNLPGVHSLGHWLEHSLGKEEVLEFSVIVAGISTIIALLGIGLAYQLYGRRPLGREAQDPLKPILGGIFAAINQKWWVDETYARLVVRPFRGLGILLAAYDFSLFRQFDRQTFKRTNSVSRLARVTQTGYLNWNLIGIIGGLLVILIILAWRGVA